MERHIRKTDKFEIKITLQGSRPNIWRRIQVPGRMNLRDLSEIFQTVMGWDELYSHQFNIDGKDYVDWSPIDGIELGDAREESKMKVYKVARKVSEFTYEYDFDAGWIHDVVIEKIISDPTFSNPTCIGGKNAYPPEDCGGMRGYENLVEVLANSNHQEYSYLSSWIYIVGRENMISIQKSSI